MKASYAEYHAIQYTKLNISMYLVQNNFIRPTLTRKRNMSDWFVRANSSESFMASVFVINQLFQNQSRVPALN